MNAADFISRLGAAAKPKRTVSGWQCRCPAHEDGKASLCVADGSDKILIHCQAGCAPEAVCAKAGLKLADLFTPKPGRNGSGKIVAAYDYTDEGGTLLFQVVRMDPKDFRQRKPDASAKDGWTWKTTGVRRVLYRLPEVVKAVARGLPVIVAEGEKDCDALAKLGLCATCNCGGAGKWHGSYNATLRGASVYVVADKDAPGRQHAQAVAASVRSVAASVRVLELPDRNGATVKDAADWLAAGGTAGELSELLDAAPEWTPSPQVEIQPASADAAGVRGLIVAALTNQNLTARDQRKAVAAAVADALAQRGQLYYHAEHRDFATAMFFDRLRCRLERIQADAFLAWLADWTGINRADALFATVAAEIETAALTDAHAKAILPEVFFVQRENRIYISSGDAALCRVSAGTVEMAANGADGVLFAAGRTLKPWTLTTPADFFQTCRLFADIQDAADNAREVVRLWTLSLPTSPRSKPPLCLYGEIGSGKTMLARGIADLYGLPPIVAKVEEKLEADFWPTVDAGGLLCLDNADSRTKWLAEAVASAATGGCVSRRRLYTDNETLPLRARAWLAITTSNATFASDSGLADRLLVIRMRRREGTTSDAALSDEIAANRDGALSFVAHTLAAALADTEPTPDGLNQRHPDFAGFAVRIGRALGREADAVAALSAAEADKSLFCLQNDTLGAALLAHVTGDTTLEGDAGTLRTALAVHDSGIAEWSNKSFGRRLSALWPHVAATFDAKRTERQGYKVFTIRTRGAVTL